MPTYIIAFAVFAIRHTLSALLWPRFARHERFHASLPLGFQIARPAPGGMFLALRIALWGMGLGALFMPIFLAVVWEVTDDGGDTRLRLLALANVLLIVCTYMIDRRLMQRWKARAFG
ncbi:MAG: hypothetical protein B7Y97_02050 [Sphingomonas sp. 32-66-10]|nr:MAG: hypothetical protein B7Y97_02050 [Sphingomonas sp. 32-66-10]